MTIIPTERESVIKKKEEEKEMKIINRNPNHSKKSIGNRTILLASKIFFSLALLILFSLPHSVQAYEWNGKALAEAGNENFPKQETFTPFSSSQLQRKGYIFGVKMNFEVNTIWSKPENKLKTGRPVRNFIGEEYFSGVNNFLNELPLAPKMSIGAKPAKLIEIRF